MLGIGNTRESRLLLLVVVKQIPSFPKLMDFLEHLEWEWKEVGANYVRTRCGPNEGQRTKHLML